MITQLNPRNLGPTVGEPGRAAHLAASNVAQRCGRSFFPGHPPRQRVATGVSRELAAGIR